MVCCYTPNEDLPISLEFSDAGTCSSGKAFVGLGDDRNGCSQYEVQRKGCVVDGICYGLTDDGGRIYQIAGILYPSSFSCPTGGSLEDLSNPVCMGGASNPIISGGGSGSSSGGGDGNESPIDQGGNFFVDDIFFQDTLEISEDQGLCGEVGGLGGLFVSKNNCEAVEVNGESCLFNPYRASIFSSKLLFREIFNFQSPGACIMRSSVKSCYMYKTKENCESNPSKDSSEVNDLQYGCRWIEPEDFAGDVFVDAGGFCISEYSEETYLNSHGYSRRGNLINDSSFENRSRAFNYAFDSLSPFGDSVVDLTSGSTIEFDLEYLSGGVSYSFFSYIKLIEEYLEGDSVSLSIDFFDRNGGFLSDYSDSIFFDSVYTNNFTLYYHNYLFRNIVTPENAFKAKIKLTSSKNILVGSVSFYNTPSAQLNFQNLLYFPEPEVLSVASNCNLCFDPLGMNLCTKNKSDLLGDCSYMVSNSSQKYFSSLVNYTGKDRNPIFVGEAQGDKFSLWKAQSLPNSELFCEMYLNETQCVDSNNYINSVFSKYHINLSEGRTLCQWNSNFGCFKDSNEDDLPDIVDGKSLFHDDSLSWSNYVHAGSDDSLSDFEYGCDIMPPVLNLFFIGTNQENETVSVSDVSGEILGNVFLRFSVTDYLNNACKQFENFENKIYLKYNISGSEEIKEIDLNQNSFLSFEFDDFFVDTSGNKLIVEGKNNISILAFDQSGNVGKNWDFKLDVDLSAPILNLSQEDNDLGTILNIESGAMRGAVISNTIGANAVFNFTLKDYSSISSCTFNLSSETARESYYVSNGTLDLSNIEEGDDGYEGNILFDLPVSNSSSDGDDYVLSLSCFDIFDQEGNYTVVFNVNANTNFMIISPIGYTGLSSSSGFIGSGPFKINAVSTDSNLSSCNISFLQGPTGPIEFDIDSDFDPGFMLPSHGDTLFKKNLTAEIEFTGTPGIRNGTYTCVDDFGNTLEGKIDYMFENSVSDFNLFSVSSSIDSNKIIQKGGNWYLWRSNTVNSYENVLKSLRVTYRNTSRILSTINNISFSPNGCDSSKKGQFSLLSNSRYEIFDFIPPVEVCEIEELTSEMEKTYLGEFTFTTLVGNSRVKPFSLNFDFSNPRFNFTGTEFVYIPSMNTIFSSSIDPLINVDFSVPTYRNFNCNITPTQTGTPREKIEFTNLNSFRLSDLHSMNLEEGDIFLNLVCVDEYNHFLTKNNLRIRYDETDPILENINFANGNNKYFRNVEGFNFDIGEVNDSIIFELIDTGEVGYNCRFKPISNSYFNCGSSSWISNEFTSFGSQRTSLYKFLFQGDESICDITSSAKSQINTARSEGRPAVFNLTIEGQCQDFSSRTTDIKKVNLSVNFVDSRVLSLDFRYEPMQAFPIFKMIDNFDANSFIFNLSKTVDIADSFMSFSAVPRLVDGVYEFESSQSINLDDFEHGEHEIYGFVMSGSNDLGMVIGTLVVDGINPELNVELLNVNDDILYGNETLVNILATDEDSGIGKIEGYLNGNLIFSFSNYPDEENFFDESFINSDFNLESDADNKEFSVSLLLENLVSMSTYFFEVKAFDFSGNEAEFNITFDVSNEFDLIILESLNTFVGTDVDKFTWFTNVSAPSLNFKTTKSADFCRIYPFVDSIWASKGVPSTFINLEGGSDFSFDLSSLELFELGGDVFDVNITLECSYQGDLINFTRKVSYVNFIPDYVLTSSNGFVLTQEPYLTEIYVRSVTPFKYLSCDYSLGGESLEIPGGEVKGVYNKTFDLSSFVSGSSSTAQLTLNCVDKLGNPGPEKIYDFTIANEPFTISEIRFVSGDLTQTLNDGTIYLSTQKTYDLFFRTNKKENYNCAYSILDSGITSGIINFIRNLFIGPQREPLFSTIPFEFGVGNLNFDSVGEYNLRIACSEAGTTNTQINNYRLQVLDPLSRELPPLSIS